MQSMAMNKLAVLFALSASGWAAGELAVYQLLEPSAHAFEIAYDTAVTKEGAAYPINPVRPGFAASKESAIDLAMGKPLEFTTVKGRDAEAYGAPAISGISL
jgi:hypothetical protein